MTPPTKPETLNTSKDRREFNRNRPLSDKQTGSRYGGGAATRKSGGKVTGAKGAAGWKKGDDKGNDDDDDDEEEDLVVTKVRSAEGAEDVEEEVELTEEEAEFEQMYGLEDDDDDEGRIFRTASRFTKDDDFIDVNDPNFVDDKDYSGFLSPSGEEDMLKYDIATRYQEGAKAGYHLKPRKKVPEFIHMFKSAFWESFKTETGTYCDAWELENHKRIRIPQPRSLRKLLFVQMPNIRDIGPVGSPAYVNAEAAWSVSRRLLT